MNKFYTITLKSKDIATDKTDSGTLIDKIAVSLDRWTYEDLVQNNIDADWDVQHYAVKEYNAEDGLIAAMRREEKRSRMDIEAMVMDLIAGKRNQNLIPHVRKTHPRLQLAAAIALEDPEAWTIMLENFKEKIGESSYYDEDGYMATYAPELAKSIQKSCDDQMSSLNHDRIFGDRDQAGIVREFEKSLELDRGSVTYYEKQDTITISWTPEEALEYLSANYLEEIKRVTLKALRSSVITDIENGQEAVSDKHKHEAAKRHEEHERLTAYRKTQDDQAEAERIAKLKALKR